MTERTTRIRSDSEREPPGLLSLLGSLPCVSQVVQAISTFNLGPVNALLKRAAYFPLLLAAPSRPGLDAFEVAGEMRRFDIVAEEERSRCVGCNQVGAPAADIRFRWRVVPDDHQGDPERAQPLPALPLLPGVSQRIEVLDWELRFRDGASGFRAYGMGRTLPDAAAGNGVALVLEMLAGYGRLAGLAGTVVASGTLSPQGGLSLGVIVRVMDPAGGLAAQGPPGPLPPEAGPEPGATWLAFFGETDPDNPVTLRISLGEGILGSNVFELMRTVDLDFDAVADRLRSRTVEGALTGGLRAQLDFNPLDPRPVSPIRTRYGVFDFRDRAGRSVGSVAADMIEGRSLRTRVEGMLLPVFRFAGFGPVQSGTGAFAGARGIMTMNSVISVLPRTLANSYILRLDDPDGRFRAAARGTFGGWTS